MGKLHKVFVDKQMAKRYISAYKQHVISREEAMKRIHVTLPLAGKPIRVQPGEEYTTLPQPDTMRCEYCGCGVEPGPTCSQCNAPLDRHFSRQHPIGLMSWSV